jgi:hypothetical protein
MGVEHGVYCIGCCWGLMLILFAVGVMSLFWMVVIALVVFAEKVLPHGVRLSKAFAVAFVGLGLWIAFAPHQVPGLTDPAKAPGMMRMGDLDGGMGRLENGHMGPAENGGTEPGSTAP